MEQMIQEEKEPLLTEREMGEVVKKHSVVGVVSSVFVLIALVVSMILFLVFLSGINDMKVFFEVSDYSFEDLIADPDNFFDEIVVSSDLENVLGKGLLKIGVSIIGFFITCLGYFIGFILGIVGMCQKNKKKLYSLLGLSFSIAAPIFFVIIGIFTMLFALV